MDTAKRAFPAHGVDASGKVHLLRPKVARAKLLALVNALPTCTIGIEACSGAHHPGRQV
jgi:transposase